MELELMSLQNSGMGSFDGLDDFTFRSCIFSEKFQNIDLLSNQKAQNLRIHPQVSRRDSKELSVLTSVSKKAEEEKETTSFLEAHIMTYGIMSSNVNGNEDFFMWPNNYKVGGQKFNDNISSSCNSFEVAHTSDFTGRKRKIWELNDPNKDIESEDSVHGKKKITKSVSESIEKSQPERYKEASSSKMPPWQVDVIEDMAADLDGSLSNLGADLAAGSYNMSEALLSLPSLTVFKQEASTLQENLINQSNLHQNVEEIQDQKSTLHRLLQQNSFNNNLKRNNSLTQNKALDIAEKKCEDCRFQYVLAAATSIATKVTEETLTYLNQGQSYEIKLKKVGELSNFRGKILKSVIRICFHERRLQYMEKEQILAWQASRPGERIVELDVPLSYGLFDVEQDPNLLNTLSFLWDPTKEVGAYIKVNCISTEFTPKKHGGEKGVPFRIQVETYIEGETTRLHAAACQIKVFKLKGADRKHKQDREKILKRPLSEQDKYQPSYECTVLNDLLPDAVFPPPSSLPALPSNNPPRPNTVFSVEGSDSNLVPHNHYRSQITSPGKLESNLLVDAGNEKRSSPGPLLSDATSLAQVSQISSESNSQQTAQWLRKNRFGNYVSAFANFCGADILRLTRDDLIQICGLADGIRLLYALHSKAIVLLTLYICTPSSPIYHAVYLDHLGRNDMAKQLSVLLGVHQNQILDIFLQGPNDIRVLVTDEVVSNIKDESMFLLEVLKDETRGRFILLLKPPPTSS